jgi:hypothetical protein
MAKRTDSGLERYLRIQRERGQVYTGPGAVAQSDDREEVRLRLSGLRFRPGQGPTAGRGWQRWVNPLELGQLRAQHEELEYERERVRRIGWPMRWV